MVLSAVALTGATGMLGRHVVSALESQGIRVLSCARVARQGKDSADRRIWDLGQWRSMDEMDALFEGAQAIVHAGAMVPGNSKLPGEAELFDVNVRACLNLGEWALARSVPVVHVSGAIVYAEQDRENIDESAPTGYTGFGGFYGLTKVLAEDIFQRLQQRGLQAAVLRPSSIYGAGLSPTKMLRKFLATAAAGGTIELVPPIEDRIDLIHAADVAAAVAAVLKTGAWTTFNLASGHPSTVREIADACLAVTGKGDIQVRGDVKNARTPGVRFSLNCERANRALGWSPGVSLHQGMAALFENRVLTPG
ncbi:UDP-glucose 4-epimerase [Sulfuricaulis limicola]|uniref:UDP-glucose 4-epimerase n=1 Tax=Sulfuricaulis limicola TaxID=1620215 RepID=A0A1B4XFE9_9GAMM|nr:NAD(P)-dependent oxidoreductase [Sulfuricaulis limicola]BAV33519.1 UDP-glucose 4-epimerase [Sulfuricaulis limicola]